MIGKDNILKITKHFVKRGKGKSAPAFIHPLREWLTILSVSVALFVVLAVYAGVVFFRQNKDIDEQISFDSTMVTYKSEEVRAVLEQYGEQVRRFQELRDDRSNREENPVTEDQPIEGEG